MRLLAIHFTLILITAFQPATAEPYTWRTVEIGGGGFVTGTVFHPTEPGLVYARTDVGGAYRLDTATNRWTALNDDVGGINNEFQHLGVLTIGVDPGDANRLYIATGQYGGTESWKLPSRIYRSTDRGASWLSHVTPGFKMAGNGESRGTGERMAVDPLNGANILVGTSDAGIWRSTDYGANWTRMTNFTPASTNFVLYAPANHLNPGPKRRVYAAANTSTAQSFWFSDDNGSTWSEVLNHPGRSAGAEMMPIQGSFDASGVFYSTWGNETGPSDGSSRYGVWKLAANGSGWTSILPLTGQGSFSGISADPRVAGHVVVSTLHRWWPGDEIYRSTDGGATWSAALRTGTRSAGNSPWSASPGAHWITDIDIDPFNSERAIFNNGFGLIQTTNLSTSGAARLWTFFSDGLEETVPLGLHSPTAGPPLISVIGDYTGFRHDHLDRSPLRGKHNPGNGSNGKITGATLAPEKMIRQNNADTYYSVDAGASWSAFTTEPPTVTNGDGTAVLSADGQRILWCPSTSAAYISSNAGVTWSVSNGTALGVSLTPIADSVNGQLFYLWNNTAKSLLVSTDGGQNFTTAATGLNSSLAIFRSVPGYTGHLWSAANDGGLYRSTNSGASFNKLSNVVSAYRVAFGKAAPAATHPAVFIWGKVGSTVGFFRSDDTGATWVRINDNQHNFGYQNDIAGDPRVYGRVYLATSGRGVVYGDFANPATPEPPPPQVIYDDALQNGWSNASAGGTSLASTDPVYRGGAAISIPAGSGKGVSLTCSSRTLEGLESLIFWIHGGAAAPPPLQIGVSRGGIALEAVPVTVPATIGWQRVAIPLTQLGIATIDDLTGLRVESRTVNSVTPGAFSLDDISFGDPTHVSITLSNLSATYNGTPKPATVTTIPTGVPVTVTYNGSATVPTAVGNYEVSAVPSDPAATGSANGTLVISKAAATLTLGNLIPSADGTPKSITVTTTPAGLATTVTYDGSITPPTLAGTYALVATVQDPNYQGTVTGTFMIRQTARAPTDITGWVSNIPGKVTAGTSSSPLLNPDDTTDAFSTNTLQAYFSPITLANTGDKITLSGALQMSLPPVSGQSNWFRFGLFDNRGQPPATATGWIGCTGMGNSLYERTATGLFSTGNGATQRTPDAPPAPVGSTSPSGNPPLAFEITATRTATGIVLTHLIKRTDTNAILMDYTFTDTTPNNNGILGSAQGTATGYTPTYNTAGFAFARSYIGTTVAQAQFSNIQISFVPGISADSQVITFPAPADRPVTSPAFDLTATASSGLPVSYQIASGPATLIGNTVTLTGVGTVVIRASQQGDIDYLPAADVERSFNVTKAPATVTLENLNPIYNGSQKSATATTNPPGKTVEFTYNDSATIPIDAGSYAVVGTINDATYQGSSSGTLVIAQAPQTINFAAPPSRTFGDAAFDLSATATSGLPVAFSIVSGPATLSGNTVTLDGAGTVVVRASQSGSSNHLAATDVIQNFTVAKATAAVTLGNLSTMFDGQPKPVTASTTPTGRNVIITYAGFPAAPTAVGSYVVVATIDDFNYQGSATGTLVIDRRSFTSPVTGWLATNITTISAADTSSPLLNSGNGSGTSGASIPFFARITPRILSAAGDSLSMRGNVAVNTPAGAANQVLWFRFGLFDNPNTIGSKTVNNWLGYTAMAQSTAANSLYERIGGTTNGDFASSMFGTSGRTPDASPAYVGANSPSGVVTLRFDQTITRTATGVTVVSRLARTGGAADTVYLSSTHTDTTPNNNGVSNGVNQTIPTDPVYSPRFDAVGFVFSGAYLNSTNTSSAQFTDVVVTYTPGTDALPQTIDFPPLADQTFSTTPLMLTATANSGLPVSYSVVSGPASVNGSALTLTGIGDVTVRASQVGDLFYLPALPVERSFTIGKALAQVTLSSLSHTYDGFAKSAVATTNPPNLTVEILYDGEQNAPYQIGSHEVTAVIHEDHYEGSASGILVISPARTDLENWRFDHFETYDDAGSAANSADPDFDGIQNLMEFALGLDPGIPSVLPASLAINGSQMEYIYTRSKAALATVNFTVERTDLLSAGTWVTDDVMEIAPPLSDNGVLQTVKVVLPMEGDRRFVRLKASVQP